MSTARDDILRRVREALHDVPDDERPTDVAIPRGFQQIDDSPHAEQVTRFIERVEDYRATVHRIKEAGIAARVAESCAARGITRLVVPADVPDTWLPRPKTRRGRKKDDSTDIDIVRDDRLSLEELESSGGVLTGCALGIAQTGTIVLDGGARQGRRIISLLPDYHLCVVYASQVVGIVPEAIQRLEDAASSQQRPITFISGPSATSDIELNRVEGVHGPRTLEVLVID